MFGESRCPGRLSQAPPRTDDRVPEQVNETVAVHDLPFGVPDRAGLHGSWHPVIALRGSVFVDTRFEHCYRALVANILPSV